MDIPTFDVPIFSTNEQVVFVKAHVAAIRQGRDPDNACIVLANGREFQTALDYNALYSKLTT